MHNIKLRYSHTCLFRKAVALLVAIVFLIDSTFGWAGDSLAPQTRMTMPQFQKAFQAGYTKLTHQAVNEYIEKYFASISLGRELRFITPDDILQFKSNVKKDLTELLPKDRWWKTTMPVTLDDGWHEDTEIMVVSIPGLLKNTGQIGHVGLGRANGLPVAYMDSGYFFNQGEIEKAVRGGYDNRKLAIVH
ncbi:MAG: hypothetical protein PHS37_06370, partial [Candidatus Omnitrophica bacterium]|nr:hypothetical protein [Candidatus Omnitrophota bacterium]